MMNLKEIGASAAALGNQMQAGIPLDQALRRLAQMQPAYAEYWSRAVLSVQAGRLLSETLSEIWPETLNGVVKAGEQSGKLDGVFSRIEETIELQQKLRGATMQLAYPFGMGLAGLAVFIGFMVFVLPGLNKSLGTNSKSFVFDLSSWMSTFAHENWTMILGGIIAGVALIVAWLRTQEARAAVLDMFLGVPVIKDAFRDLYFGLWANYMAMVVAAGITTTEALKMTAVVLPSVMNDSVLAFERDLTVSHRSMSDAVDPEKLPANDLRVVWWPFYISNAFIIAEQTGAIDRELLRVAPSLIKDGMAKLGSVISVANVVALAVSAFLIVSPLAAYYVEIFSAVQQAGR